MSESGHSTAMVPIRGNPFKMPNFKGRVQHMSNQWQTLLKTTNLDIKNHVDKETTKAITKISNNINDGAFQVTDDQQDLHKIITKIKALNKKVELERKIKHMGINEALFRKDEMQEKLQLLKQNVDLLGSDNEEEENYDDMEGEGEGHSMKRNNHNRRSVDAIHTLEDRLGLPISNSNARVMNFKDKMHVSKDELIKSQESAEQFVSKMKEKQKELKQKRMQRQQKQAYKTQTIMDKTSQKKKEHQEKQKERVLERIEEHKAQLEKVKEVREAREQSYKQYKQKEKKTKRLYEKIEENYNKEILMPELERKKKELEHIRRFHKPIKREELDEHEKNYQEKIKIELEKQRLKREKWYSDIGYGVYDENKYKTKFYEKAMEENKHKDDDKRVNSEEKKRKHEKMGNYAKIVKEMHWPQVSDKKKRELEDLKYQMENSNKPHFKSPIIKSRYNSSESPEREKVLERPNWKKFNNPMLPKPEEKRQPIKVDWLAERRNKKDDQDKTSTHQNKFWKGIVKNNNLDENSKAQLLKTKARMLEETAERKEQFNRIQGNTMEGTVEVNEMLIDAIESKLSLLDNYMKN